MKVTLIKIGGLVKHIMRMHGMNFQSYWLAQTLYQSLGSSNAYIGNLERYGSAGQMAPRYS